MRRWVSSNVASFPFPSLPPPPPLSQVRKLLSLAAFFRNFKKFFATFLFPPLLRYKSLLLLFFCLCRLLQVARETFGGFFQNAYCVSVFFLILLNAVSHTLHFFNSYLSLEKRVCSVPRLIIHFFPLSFFCGKRVTPCSNIPPFFSLHLLCESAGRRRLKEGRGEERSRNPGFSQSPKSPLSILSLLLFSMRPSRLKNRQFCCFGIVALSKAKVMSRSKDFFCTK